MKKHFPLSPAIEQIEQRLFGVSEGLIQAVECGETSPAIADAVRRSPEWAEYQGDIQDDRTTAPDAETHCPPALPDQIRDLIRRRVAATPLASLRLPAPGQIVSVDQIVTPRPTQLDAVMMVPLHVLLDAPAHGEDHRPTEPTELNAWRVRLDQGENFVANFNTRARAVLDYLVKERYADPKQVAACGTSRGGFLAFHLAAAEPRIRCVGGIAPVTDLRALREFKPAQHPEAAEALSLIHVVPQLAGRPAWMCIGNNDGRVSTESAIAFSRALVQAGAAKVKDGETVPVDLVVNSSAGHRSSFHDHEILAEWLLEHMK